MNLQEDISKTIALLKGEKLRSSGNMVYQQTNEGLDYYFPYFPIEDGNVLTVAASGDQTLQALSLGAKDVTTFDINSLTYYFSFLKYAGVLAFTLEEFKEYFGYKDYDALNFRNDYNATYKPFSIELYEKVRPYLEKDVREYFDSLYLKGNFVSNSTKLLIPEHDFRKRSKDSFLEINNYEMIKTSLGKVNINFIKSDLLNLPSVLKKNNYYNSMFFSNIFDWLYPMTARKYLQFIEKEMTKFLSDDGVIAVYSPVFGDSKSIARCFPKSIEIKTESVNKEIFTTDNVKVYTYNKNKK